MAEEAPPPVVIDNGSESCKVGLAGEDDPASVLLNLLGEPKQGGKDRFVGQEALDKEADLNLKYPVERGVVTDWEAMELVWEHAYKKVLKVPPKNHPVLITDTPKNPKTNREKMAEIMFEKFQVPAFFVSSPAVLCLYASGRTTGTVLDIGSGVTTAVPVYEGYPVPDSIARMDMAGYDITEYLIKLLADQGLQFNSPTEKATARAIKHKLSYVAQDYQSELSKSSAGGASSSAATYELPDGKAIKLDSERFQCTEALFQPSLVGRAGDKGIHHMVNEAISACEMDTRKKLYTNVILCGGTSMTEGLADRLRKELNQFGPLGAAAKVSAPQFRHLLAWSGGSILAGLPMFKTIWIDKSSYEDAGRDIIHKKCM